MLKKKLKYSSSISIFLLILLLFFTDNSQLFNKEDELTNLNKDINNHISNTPKKSQISDLELAWSLSSQGGNDIWKIGDYIYTCQYYSYTAYSGFGLFGGAYEAFFYSVKKIDLDGKIIWQYNDLGRGMQRLEVNGIWGNNSAIYIYGDSIFSNNNTDIFLFKLDLAGNMLWRRNWGGFWHEHGNGIWGDESGIYTNGYTGSYGIGDSDICVIKWNSEGNILWNRTWGSNQRDIGTGIWGDITGIYTYGYIHTNTLEGPDLCVIKWDKRGYQLWNRTWNQLLPEHRMSFWDDWGNGIWGDNSGIIISAYACSNSCVIKLDSDGNILWHLVEMNLTKNGPGRTIIRGDDSRIYIYGLGGLFFIFSKEGKFLKNFTLGDLYSNRMKGFWVDKFSFYLIGDYLSKWNFISDFLEISHPLDIQCPIGTICRFNWTFSEEITNCTSYYISRDGIPIRNGTWISEIPIEIITDQLLAGNYTYSILALDGFGDMIRDDVLVSVANFIPIVTHPGDFEIPIKNMGCGINWTIIDLDTNATSYCITRNGIPIKNGTWTSRIPIELVTDQLLVGYYNYSILVSDGFGAVVQDDIFVTCNILPKITRPHDLRIQMGTTGYGFNWTITDPDVNRTFYSILVNGKEFQNGSWKSGQSMIVHFDNLSCGNWIYTIIVSDGYGGKTQDDVRVNVFQPEIDTNSTNQDSPPNRIQPFFTFAISLVFALIGLIFFIDVSKWLLKSPGKYQN